MLGAYHREHEPRDEARAVAPLVLLRHDERGMGLRVAPLALEAAHDGIGGGEHPRFGFVAEEIGNPRGGASAIAREALEGCLSNPMVETVVDAVVAADARVKAECPRGQGAAFAACLVHSTSSAATLVHLGDCRIHLFRGGLLECLSRDHTLWNQYLDLGHSPEGMNETWRSIVVRALGMVSGRGDVVPTVVPCTPGDVVVLTTDGLHSRVSQHELRRAAAPRGRPWCRRACDRDDGRAARRALRPARGSSDRDRRRIPSRGIGCARERWNLNARSRAARDQRRFLAGARFGRAEGASVVLAAAWIAPSNTRERSP